MVQEAFMVLLRKKHTWNHIRDPESYMAAVVRHRLLMLYSRQKKEPIIFDTNLAASHSEGLTNAGDDPLSELMARQFLRSMFNGIPSTYRDVLSLQIFGGCTHEEIASALGISPVSARSYRARAISYALAAARQYLK
jgi:RNA polymerase sigma factor (sigma-70 family)